MPAVSITTMPAERLGAQRVVAQLAGAGGPVASVTWHVELLGPLDEPFAQRVSHVVAGVHDPSPRHRGDRVADATCEALGGQPCFWRPAPDPAGLVVAFVADGDEALEEGLMGLLAELG